MEGEFHSVLNNAKYIEEMGSTFVCLIPIYDKPDQTFSGEEQMTYSGYKDVGKTGYHGYWASSFYEVDEHFESKEFRFADLIMALKGKYSLNFVLDIVGDHGSPAYTMR